MLSPAKDKTAQLIMASVMSAGLNRLLITLDTAGVIDGLYVTNNNYAYYSMLNGDAFAKKFGGGSSDDEDWFLLTITGKDVGGVANRHS